MTITHQTALPVRVLAWLNQRFGPAPILLYLLLYLTGMLFTQIVAKHESTSLRPLHWVPFLAIFGYFLLVRVLDEHKDYAKDCVNYPERILQRGLVTLDHLKVVGILALVPQVVISLVVDGGFGAATAWWLVLMAWTALMTKEFFVGDWLEPRLALYAVLHIVAGPIALVWTAALTADGHRLPWSIGWLAALPVFVGLGLEVGRKLQAPDDERPTVASYTRQFGVKGAAIALSLMTIGAAAVVAGMLSAADVDAPAALVVLALAVLAAVGAAARFAVAPTRANVQSVETVGAVAMLAILVTAIVTLYIGG